MDDKAVYQKYLAVSKEGDKAAMEFINRLTLEEYRGLVGCMTVVWADSYLRLQDANGQKILLGEMRDDR